MTLEFILRLLLAGLLGAAIGLEREFRAKEAGLRTHFLVAMGSSLIMIVSQFGFQGSEGVPGTRHADVARVAAQIVSGVGFLGAGTIIMQRQSVRGLTTAAGLWVAAGIGMAVGGGLYALGAAATVFTLLGLELYQLFRNVKVRLTSLILTIQDRDVLIAVTNSLNEKGFKIVDTTVVSEYSGKSEYLRVTMTLRSRQRNNESQLLQHLQQHADVKIEKIE